MPFKALAKLVGGGGLGFTRVQGLLQAQAQVLNVPGAVQVANTPGAVQIANTPGAVQVANTEGVVKVANVPDAMTVLKNVFCNFQMDGNRAITQVALYGGAFALLYAKLPVVPIAMSHGEAGDAVRFVDVVLGVLLILSLVGNMLLYQCVVKLASSHEQADIDVFGQLSAMQQSLRDRDTALEKHFGPKPPVWKVTLQVMNFPGEGYSYDYTLWIRDTEILNKSCLFTHLDVANAKVEVDASKAFLKLSVVKDRICLEHGAVSFQPWLPLPARGGWYLLIMVAAGPIVPSSL
mmetsp:Transcript_34673/g.80931  ORF Transcript_34673/g.80931 Transcript_34673/m.80931 type:complete len:292 (+) Transcript_34673:75-950(+)|eukprot:CAMPEP_0178403970 /NCGR_PEP_ID=MMETSP0689_2-20121128/17641_1 /TAXON_ID=160604 /ORGANISM="Amphidinium massartii, Strain CS-259" /LENGTH=291 /DNA_ID=CAMNT_0020024937 /DNA_START=74 /DNA_END=949 /DNA_ORIENTATION=+